MRNYNIEPLFIETAFVTDVTSCGKLIEIGLINPSDKELEEDSFHNKVILLTEGKNLTSFLKKDPVAAVIINEHLTVTQVIFYNPDDSNSKKNFGIVPERSFAVFAEGNPKNEGNNVEIFKEHFTVGNIIRLRWMEEAISYERLEDLKVFYEGGQLFILDGTDIYATNELSTEISGTLYNVTDTSYYITISVQDSNGQLIGEEKVTFAVSEKYARFNIDITLLPGVNYIDVVYHNDQFNDGIIKSKVVYSNTNSDKDKRLAGVNEKQVIMWIEQYVNAKALDTPKKIADLVALAKREGVTSFALDVKGCGGYAAYKKASLTNVPYMTETTNPQKRIDVEIDFLEEFIKAAHALDMKVYASINFFVEGMLQPYDSAIDIANTHPEWAEVIQAPEDSGELKSILDTKKSAIIIYVNPANDEVQEFQLKRAQEVLENYDVDGLIMDRTRYDNQYADFSEVSKAKFQQFLRDRNKELVHWPQDIYSFDSDGAMRMGPLYYDWLTFRCGVITEFSTKLRTLVDQYKRIYKKEVALAAYVGSWYEIYYQNGVNWADKDFLYNPRLNFPLSELYTKDYGQMSYLDNIDFLMIGCYYTSKQQIEKYIALGMLLTNHKVPLIGSISLPDLATKELQRTGFEACYEYSDGCMIFDLCYVDWDKLSYAMNGAKK